MGNKAKNKKAVYVAVIQFKQDHDGNMGTFDQIREYVHIMHGINITFQWVGKLIQELVVDGKLEYRDGHICVDRGVWTLKESAGS